MQPRSLAGRSFLGVGLVFAAGTGCAEHQFLLRVRDPGPIDVTATTEAVSRVVGPPAPVSTTRPQGPQAGSEAPRAGSTSVAPPGLIFPDLGVTLQSGTQFPYWRDGEWMASVEPVRVAERGGRIVVDFTLHPGRRDLPLSLSTDRENVCELRTRDRLDRALGWAGLVVGATAGVFVPITALSDDRGTRKAAPYVGGVAAALLIAGAAWVLWPAGAALIVVPPSCGTVGVGPAR